MGYDIHITRREFWSDPEGPSIALYEWESYVATDPDIQSDPENPGAENYILVSHPECWPLWWNARRGEISSKNPDEAVISKMVQIARALNARVLGDDDEIYGVNPSDPSISETR